ncbi:uncharacterized protein FMAN_15409 [Fusarium mangiferae]|uniref:Uncharacterized protein n=1 Tax=Fusarium mangiferae TaxID=192010 RepID=A0A1L7UIM6_FUSMA|nr:uncharacterized protein FMAN_15409 [Fusarium mangiferae]CVL09062.1 uncharacterized protein FMAN_15409 [Fusarium mangiferae]
MAPMMKFFYAGLLAASTFTSAVFASPIDNIAVVVESRGETDESHNTVSKPYVKYLSEGVNTPIGIDIANAVAVAVRNVDKDAASLEKRVFTSPHVRKAFKVVAGNMISAASWAFNFWVEEDYTGKSTLWYSGLTGGGVTSPKIGVEGATFIKKSGTELDIKVPFLVRGFYAGKEIVVHFIVRILSDAGETSVQYFYGRPTATIAGQNAPVSSWDFVNTK